MQLIPTGWQLVPEARRVALGDRVWNGRRYVDLSAILGCEKVARGQTVIRNVQMHRSCNGYLGETRIVPTACGCTNGIIRSLGRDNDEIIEDCPLCSLPNVQVSHTEDGATNAK